MAFMVSCDEKSLSRASKPFTMQVLTGSFNLNKYEFIFRA